MKLSPNPPPEPPAQCQMHIRGVKIEFLVSYLCQSPQIYRRNGIVAGNDKKCKNGVFLVFSAGFQTPITFFLRAA